MTNEKVSYSLKGYDPQKGGCSPIFFALLLGVSVQTIRNKLKKCPPVDYDGRAYYYRFEDAINFLAKPAELDLTEFIATSNKKDWPVSMQKEWWLVQQIRTEVEEKTGKLWHSEKVMEVLTEIAQSIKYMVQLWPDELNREVGITPEQRAILIRLTDRFQDRIVGQIETTMADHTRINEMHELNIDIQKSEKKANEQFEEDFMDMFPTGITHETDDDVTEDVIIEDLNASEDHWETMLKGFEDAANET